MKDNIVVTFIGGPWDLMKRAFSSNDIDVGTYCVAEPPPFSQSYLRGLGERELKTEPLSWRIHTYRFVPIRNGYDRSEVWVGIHEEPHHRR